MPAVDDGNVDIAQDAINEATGQAVSDASAISEEHQDSPVLTNGTPSENSRPNAIEKPLSNLFRLP